MTTLSISQAQYLEVQKNPDLFMDGLISGRETGLVVMKFLNGEEALLRIFEAPVDCELFTIGEPIAFHRSAGVLASSDLWVAAKELIVHRETRITTEGNYGNFKRR